MRFRNTFLLLLLIFTSCATQNKNPIKSTLLKPIRIGSKEKKFQLNPDKEIDIIHTELNVSFDWKQHLCLGNERIIFIPYFYALDSFSLDAKNFIIGNTVLSHINGKVINHRKKYDNKRLTFSLDKPLRKNDTLILAINYTAQPDKNNTDGSKAITDDKGLYFINTEGKEPYKPMQIWTQGETESNSNWFATVDKPFEKMTFDINITVPDSMTTLSNGIFINKTYSTDNKKRTDHWTAKKPMSAYLVMMAIGKFDKITDQDYNGKEVSYYLEPKYAPYAKNIFNHTPEMIDFFSQKLGVPYPWSKYSQVVVRDFVSGAMENTSATLHGDFVQKNNRQLLDSKNDGIVAHELFHHWFGDLVTCASWSHLTLNEGFATFGEQLWFGHKYGKTGELKRIHQHMNSYLGYSKSNDESPIRFHYKDKENMFDAIIYQKGSRILNLLKFELGEKAFFAGLKNYLNKYSYKTAQIEQLRHEFELVSGKDLRFFFKQWFHQGGHPNVDFNVDSTRLLSIKQTQKGKLFHFPFQYRNGNNINTLKCSKKVTTFQLDSNSTNPIFPDPNSIFIGSINNLSRNQTNISRQYEAANNYIEKIRILEQLRRKKEKGFSKEELQTLFIALKDKDADLSYSAMKTIEWSNETIKEKRETLKEIATFSDHPKQKAQAIYILSVLEDDLLFSDFMTWANDSSYLVSAAGLYGLKKIKQEEALRLAHKLAPNAEDRLFKEVCSIFATSGDSTTTYFENELMKRFNYERRTVMQSYGTWAKRFNSDVQDKFWSTLFNRAKEEDNINNKYTAVMTLHKFSKDNDLVSEEKKEELKSIIASEEDKELRRRYINSKLLPKPKIEE